MLEYIQRNQQCPPERGLYLYEKFTDAPEFTAYRDLPEQVAGYADFFREQGIEPGARVLFPFESTVPVILAFLGLMELGAVPLSVKPYGLNQPKDAYQEFLARIARDFAAARILLAPTLESLELPVAACRCRRPASAGPARCCARRRPRSWRSSSSPPARPRSPRGYRCARTGSGPTWR